MKKSAVLKIAGLTKEEKAAAERWFNSGLNKGKEIEGDEKEVKAILKANAEKYVKDQEKKAKNGTLKEVQTLVQSLCKGHKEGNKVVQRLFTYREIIDIINEGTQAVVEREKQLQELLQWKKDRNKARRGQ